MLDTLSILWNNVWFKFVVSYWIYILVIWFLIFVLRWYIKQYILNTKTTLDDKILEKTQWLFTVLILLLWLTFLIHFWEISFKKSESLIALLNCVQVIIFIMILIKTTKEVAKHFSKKFKETTPSKLSMVNFLSIISKIILFVIWALWVMNILWIDITPFLASAWILWIAIAMGSQQIVNNFLSGIIIFFDKPFSVWDKLIIDWEVIFVEQVWIRTTKFKTLDWNVVIIPNWDLLSKKIENQVDKIVSTRRVSLNIWLPYWVDSQKAKDIIKEVFEQDERIIKDTFMVWMDSLWDWSVNFMAIAQVDFKDYTPTINKDLLESAYKKFNKKGIGFPFPTYDVNVEKK